MEEDPLKNLLGFNQKQLLIMFLLTMNIILLWKTIFGSGGLLEIRGLSAQIVEQKQELNKLHNRNKEMIEMVSILKKFPAALEGQARYELGLIKPNETYFQVVMPVDEQ